ncbi:MAG: ADP-ribosylglycohydrolase family protein [Burkholderiales bacterium]|nr:ADP-ribosylglycohydrolase family protein [Burkholderiales bacterium]
MLGAIIGDIVGSVYEFDNLRRTDFTPLFHPEADFTDDTVCTIAVAEALLDGRHPGEALLDWCTRYPGRGYGGRFAEWLRRGDLKPYRSFGNGSAMRVGPAGLLAASLEEARVLAERVTVVTHDHPEGIKGAVATAEAIWLARSGASAPDIRAHVAATHGYDMARTTDGIRPVYRFNETCQQTVPEALICALEATDFEHAIRLSISIGGDSDTVAAIAGAVAEARFGVPQGIAGEARARLPADMLALLERLYAA